MAEKTEDLNLPLNVVARIIKDSLPDGVVVSKEAKLAVSRVASVFVLYTTTTASSYTQNAKRKILTANDVLDALKELEFEEFVESLEQSLKEHRSQQQQKRSAKQASTSAAGTGEENADAVSVNGKNKQGGSPPKKAKKLSSSDSVAVAGNSNDVASPTKKSPTKKISSSSTTSPGKSPAKKAAKTYSKTVPSPTTSSDVELIDEVDGSTASNLGVSSAKLVANGLKVSDAAKVVNGRVSSRDTNGSRSSNSVVVLGDDEDGGKDGTESEHEDECEIAEKG